MAVEVRRAEIVCPELSRFLYTAVGGPWFWVDRLPWSYDRWRDYLSQPGFETWLAYVKGTPAGYYELAGEAGGLFELVSFGVLPQFTGQGIGGHLLTHAVQRAWASGATRVWLHTSSFDHPRAGQLPSPRLSTDPHGDLPERTARSAGRTVGGGEVGPFWTYESINCI